jgi:hypothetical protein
MDFFMVERLNKLIKAGDEHADVYTTLLRLNLDHLYNHADQLDWSNLAEKNAIFKSILAQMDEADESSEFARIARNFIDSALVRAACFDVLAGYYRNKFLKHYSHRTPYEELENGFNSLFREGLGLPPKDEFGGEDITMSHNKLASFDLAESWLG